MTEMKGSPLVVGVLLVLLALSWVPTEASENVYQFNIQYVNRSVNCHEKTIISVNGMFPGPVLYAEEGGRVIVNVTNSVNENVTVHFHGIRQEKSVWMDGVAYVTMCPLQLGDYFVHNFTIPLQRGTYLWHAHYNWQRATIHGAIVVKPAAPYPFATPYAEFPVILGEWWNGDIPTIEAAALKIGTPFPTSDAITINGFAGPTYNCSQSEGVSILNVVPGKTYLLRVINAALNTQLYFQVGSHVLTVVEADGAYVFPFESLLIALAPGQTTMVLVTANQAPATYYMTVSGFGNNNPIPLPVALFQYPTPPTPPPPPVLPTFPIYNDTGILASFTNSLKTLYPGRVPLTVNRHILLVIGISLRLCLPPPQGNCSTPYRFQGQVNNITFELPSKALLESSYFNVSGVFTEDFPQEPQHPFDWTNVNSPPPAGRISQGATRLIPINFNETVQIVLQDTMIFGFENHPFHLHGHNFYVLGQGFGNYNESIDSLYFNLYDPPLRNTVGVPYRGWVAIRIKMNNPGIWLLHCHLDKHTSWGMETVFHVHNGNGAANSYDPPPSRLIKC